PWGGAAPGTTAPPRTAGTGGLGSAIFLPSRSLSRPPSLAAARILPMSRESDPRMNQPDATGCGVRHDPPHSREEGEGMYWNRARVLLVACITVAAALQARAGCADGSCGAAPAADCCAPAPAYRTVTVTEWVPQQYTATRTVYRTEYTNETY